MSYASYHNDEQYEWAAQLYQYSEHSLGSYGLIVMGKYYFSLLKLTYYF